MDKSFYGKNRKNAISEAEKAIGYVFENKEYLVGAFTHSSFAHIKKTRDNERLEFLGDSVLNFIVSDMLCKTDRASKEGALSKIRASVVSTTSLAKVCFDEGFDEFAVFSLDKESCEHGKKIYADIVEAIIAAIYLDGGMKPAYEFVLRVLGDKINKATPDAAYNEDSKTALQEYVQKRKLGAIEYELIEKTGEDHNPSFKEACKIGGKEFGVGVGPTKKDAQRAAADEAIKRLKGENN